jgi:hypothetical protein
VLLFVAFLRINFPGGTILMAMSAIRVGSIVGTGRLRTGKTVVQRLLPMNLPSERTPSDMTQGSPLVRLCPEGSRSG